MAWTTPKTWISEPLTSNDLNTHLRDNLEYLKVAITPIGALMPFAGATAPTGWFLCDGSAVSRTTYADLFAVVGVNFGVGDGASTFNLPDMRGRVPGGLDNMGGTSADIVTDAEADGMGGEIGTETHTLTITEMPAHTHSPRYNASGSGGSSISANPNNASPITSGPASTSAGGGEAHNNMQPTLFMNYIIKY